MTTFARVLSVIGILAIVTALGAAAVLIAGAYNVGALSHHSTPVERLLDGTMERSVRAHARGLQVPPQVNLRDPSLAQRAVGDYNEMCALCHGAPGVKPAFWTVGMYPPAPDLTNRRREQAWTDTDVYWIIKHGIADTGMTAFGATHNENELWALTALVRQITTLSPAQYQQWTAKAHSDNDEGHATHGHTN